MLRRSLTVAAMVAVVAHPGAASAAPTTFTLAGTSKLIDDGRPGPALNLPGLLGGTYDDGRAIGVPYPAALAGMDHSVALGADLLVARIQTTAGAKRVIGLSQGAIAIAEAKRRLAALPVERRPDRDTLTFVTIGDPTRPRHGALAQLGYRTPDTPYDTVTFTREYDGFADLPDRLNPLALLNAAAGIVVVHPHYGERPSGLTAKNVTTTVNGAGGSVTDVLIPTAHLPMLQPLYDLGLDADGLEHVLKPMVDAGYSRNDDVESARPVP